MATLSIMKAITFNNESQVCATLGQIKPNALSTGRRSLRLLEILARPPHEKSFSDLADEMDLSGATLTRLLKMLVDEDWIRQRQTSNRYTLGYRTKRFGHALRGFGLQSNEVQGTVASLAYNVGHSACLASYQGDYFVITAKTEIHYGYHFIDVFAPNTDWIDNGMGQVLLAYQPDGVAKAIYDRQYGIVLPDTHLEGFRRIRDQGHLVRREGPVTRFSVGLSNPVTRQVRDVMSVAALNTSSVDVEGILAQVITAASEAANLLPEVSQVSASLGNENLQQGEGKKQCSTH